ncbi:permease of the major facilitator superfamily [Klebsiella oxytoca]|nr:permease of the major facilitator superfamily [Klebsiella oxytoca]
MSINTLARVFTPHGNIVYTANDFRQTLRIAVAGTIALSISTFYDVQYGVFFVVYPLMLLSLVPVFNRHVARQFVFSAAVNCVEMVLIVGYLSQWPVIMTLVVFGLYVMRFRFMSQGPLFLLGSMGVVCQSTMLNFMSYPTSNWHTLMFSNMEACVMAVALSALLNYFIPDVEPRKPPPRIEKDAARIRHESLLSGSVATMIFVIFQVCDLSDSLSALMAGILILFPMHYRGAVISSIWRVVGVVLACLYILVVQLIIYDFSNHMVLMMPLIGLGLAFSARLHVMEKVGGRRWLRQHHHYRHHVRPEPASGPGPGVQRSVPHYLRDRGADRYADHGLSYASAAELLCANPVRGD